MFTNNFYRVLAIANTTSNDTIPYVRMSTFGNVYRLNGELSTSAFTIQTQSNIDGYGRFFNPSAIMNYSGSSYPDLYRVTGTLYPITNDTNSYYGNSRSQNYVFGVIIGSGTAAPALTDYCLESQITTFTATTTITTALNAQNKIETVAVYTITNTGADSFTVREIGETVGAGSERILIERSLLATPVTIAAGKTGVVTYKITLG